LKGSYRPRGFGGFSVFPPIIKNLLIINGVVWFLQIVMNEVIIGNASIGYILNRWLALNPISGADHYGNPYNFQVWQLITYQFMHSTSGFGHILFNMFALWMFGMEIENLWGSKKFVYFYLTCGVVAGLFQLFLTPLLGAQPAPTIGASGAVYGVLIAFGLLFPDRHIYLYFLFPIRAKYLIGFLIILEFLLFNPAGSIARLAHIGGALAGFLFIMFDKTIDAPFKRTIMNLRSGSSRSGFTDTFNNLSDKFKRRHENIENANYRDVEKRDEEKISQEEIDKILDKISQSGYQNLTEHEKKVLFEASKKMN
jgi:membrane associated rhomboid family serine protease